MKEKTLPLLCLLALCATPAQAIILFGLDNSANRTDPATGAPFASVARLSDGSGGIGGSGIYLGDGYVLTANHVTPFSSVTFDGVTFFQHDGATPVQVASDVDLKIIRLTTTPTVAAVQLYTGTLELNQTGTLVGWGVGRNSTVPVNSADVAWDNTTSDKRWGLNVPRTTADISFGTGSYEALVTVLGGDSNPNQGLGPDEAAVTLYDSGSGLFQQIGGVWYLTGLATAVEFSGESSYGQDATTGVNRGDFNYFVRVSNHAAQINSIIPEPSALLLTCPALLLLLRRRR